MMTSDEFERCLAANAGRPIWGGPGGEIRAWCDRKKIHYGSQGWEFWEAVRPLLASGRVRAWRGPNRRKYYAAADDTAAARYARGQGWRDW